MNVCRILPGQGEGSQGVEQTKRYSFRNIRAISTGIYEGPTKANTHHEKGTIRGKGGVSQI